MSNLKLRNQLTRPLTHDELDLNFVLLEIKEWSLSDYLNGEIVYRETSGGTVNMFQCITPHSATDYPFSVFTTGITISGTDYTLWKKIATSSDKIVQSTFSSGTLNLTYEDGTTVSTVISGFTSSDTYVTGHTISGTVLTLEQNDPLENEVIDLNDITITGSTLSDGITKHSFKKIIESDFSDVTFDSVFSNGDTTTIKHIKIDNSELLGKNNYVVVDLVSNEDKNYIIELPQLNSVDDLTKLVNIIAKRNNISGVTYNLLISTVWDVGGDYRIIAPSIKTEVTNVGHFIPLESLESVELLWDGNDWLVTKINKQQYVQENAANYLTDISTYVIRDLDDLT